MKEIAHTHTRTHSAQHGYTHRHVSVHVVEKKTRVRMKGGGVDGRGIGQKCIGVGTASLMSQRMRQARGRILKLKGYPETTID